MWGFLAIICGLNPTILFFKKNNKRGFFLKKLIKMLRFPLNTKLILVTTAGVIKCEIIRATNEYILCKNVEYQGETLGRLYIDRSEIVGFSDTYQKNSDEENIVKAIKKARILQFRDYDKKVGKG